MKKKKKKKKNKNKKNNNETKKNKKNEKNKKKRTRRKKRNKEVKEQELKRSRMCMHANKLTNKQINAKYSKAVFKTDANPFSIANPHDEKGEAEAQKPKKR